MLNVNDYLTGDDTAISQDIFASQYTSRQLAFVLADEISIRSNHPARVQFLEEYNIGPMGGWIRGCICRALAERGVTVQTINRRKS